MKRDMTRRQMLGVAVNLAGIAALPFVVEAGEQREHKAVTKAGLVRSLMALAVKAETDGLAKEAAVIIRAAKEMM